MKKFLAGLVTGVVMATAVGVGASGNVRLFVDGREVVSDVSPQIINGRTMVPARGLAEALGATVDWNQESNSVIVTTKPPGTLSTTMQPFTISIVAGGTTLPGVAIIDEAGELAVQVRSVMEVNNLIGAPADKSPSADAVVSIGNASFVRSEMFEVQSRTYLRLGALRDKLGWTITWESPILTIGN